VFLRGDGSYEDVEINRRATGPTPAELSRIPRRLCVVAGEAKLRPLLAAIRAGAVTDLIIDEPTARRLAPPVRARGR
jgi:DNA-binding transcriptional regulator LsrR (DeoR family)